LCCFILFALRSLLGQVDAKRPLKEELLKQLHEEAEQTPGELKLFCDDLLSSWHSTQQELMARKTELTAMLEHSDNVTTKGREVAQWLNKLESVYADAAVGKTRDVLLRQIREVNQVNRELQQYGHHVTLLSQVILFVTYNSLLLPYWYVYKSWVPPVPVVRIRILIDLALLIRTM
jgi:hypothetical protein